MSTADNIITGYEAIEYAEKNGLTLKKYADPIEDAREGLSPNDAREIAQEDPSLIYVASKMKTYSINTIDSETAPAWMAITAKVIPGAQDSGRCRFSVDVTEEKEADLIAALDADDGVIEYSEAV